MTGSKFEAIAPWPIEVSGEKHAWFCSGRVELSSFSWFQYTYIGHPHVWVGDLFSCLTENGALA